MIEREIANIIRSEMRPQKVMLVYGARRVGKTVLVNHIAKEFNGKVSVLNGEDQSSVALLQNRTASHFRQLFSDTELLVIDEAQHINGIGQILKLIVDEVDGVSVIATGSSSFDLQNKAGNPLVGRSYEFQLFPLSVEETLTATTRVEFLKTLDWQLIYGSYPELTLIPQAERKQRYLTEIVQVYLLKDILMVDGIKNSSKMMQLLQLLAYQIGSEVSYEEIAVKLALSRNTVEKYIDLLQKTFVIYRLPAFSRNPRREVTKPGKVYFTDTGIRNAVIGDFRPVAVRQDVGALWENYLISERLKQQKNKGFLSKHYFWRTYSGQEINLIEETNGDIAAFEFKWGQRMPKVPSAFAELYPAAPYKVINQTNMLEFV
ncbi:MAG: ATP-binding protein [Paludibacteraceae bacterium]|nr:ATP-binding protein [Paludibacteraceae bacterium]